ncbi:MAG: hypothetical protein JWL64_1576 [Frankiales bacterium]|nr:hypothetical protein [Frankiales bacterium]
MPPDSAPSAGPDSPGPLDFPAHFAAEADRLTGVLRSADLSARVPGCGDWTLQQLAVHLGGIHRWCLSKVTGERSPRTEPTAAELPGWFADGAQRLHAVLSSTDPSTPCQGFDGPDTVAFWIRRMAQETAVHRVDAQGAATGPGSHEPIEAELAADGIAEVLEVFLPRQIALGRSSGPPCGLVLRSPEGTWRWEGPEPVTVTGTSSDVLLALWGRPSTAELSDPAAFDAVRSAAIVP